MGGGGPLSCLVVLVTTFGASSSSSDSKTENGFIFVSLKVFKKRESGAEEEKEKGRDMLGR